MRHPGLSKAQFEELGRYIRALADHMGLADWTFNLSYEEPSEEKSGASIECYYGRKGADIFIRADARERPIEEFRETIVHELIHCHVFVPWQMVQQDLLSELGQSAYNVFCDGYRRAMEYGVDGLAEVFAKNMPTIEWPK